MSTTYRTDIINEVFIVKVLKVHENEATKVELVEFSAEPGTAKGDNFLGDLASVKVKSKVWLNQENDPIEKSFHWMVKMLKPDPKDGVPNFSRILGAFEREMYIYKDVLPHLNKMSPLKSCPLIYVDGTPGREVLVLEHMKQHGWRDAYKKKQGLTLDFVNLVVEWLAKFHGLSYVMINRHTGGKDEWLKENSWCIPTSLDPPSFLLRFSEMMKEEQTKNFLRIAAILENGDPDAGYVKFLNDLLERGVWVDDVRKSMQEPKEPFCTINHLDPWFNNMLFHYKEGTDEPDDVLLLDFQISSYCHPGNDLAHFLMTSTTADFRNEHLHDVLRAYHSTLHKIISEAGIELKYTFEDLLEDYSIGKAIGLVFCLFALPMVLADPDDTVDFGGVDFTNEEETKKFGDEHAKNFEKILQKSPEIQKRIRGVFDDLKDAKLLV